MKPTAVQQKKSLLTFFVICFMFMPTSVQPRLAYHAPFHSLKIHWLEMDRIGMFAQTSPEDDCIKGINYFDNNQQEKALPLLVSGTSSYQTYEFSDYDNLSICALELGVLYSNLGDNSRSLESFQIALWASMKNGNYQYQVSALNNMGTIYTADHEYEKALELLQQSLDIQNMAGYKQREGQTLASIGAVYYSMGQKDDALPYFQQGLELMRGSGDDGNIGRILSFMGDIYTTQAKYDLALSTLQEALEMNQIAGDREGEASTLSRFATIYSNQDDYSTALEYEMKALEILREVGDRRNEEAALANIGFYFNNQEKYSQALEYSQRALVIAQEIGNDKDVATALNTIGVVYLKQGRYAESLYSLEKALEVAREMGDKSTEAAVLNNIGGVYSNQGNSAQALEFYNQALVIWQELNDSRNVRTAENNIGSAYGDQSDYPNALEFYLEAVTTSEKTGDEANKARALNGIGVVYAEQGNYESALSYLSQALVIERKIGNKRGEAVTLETIGSVYADQNDDGQALDYYRQSIDIINSLRTSAGDDFARASFIDQFITTYTKVIELYEKLGQPEMAFEVSEQARARSFLDSLSTGYIELSDAESNSIYITEREAYLRLQSIHDALNESRAIKQADEKLIADLKAQLTQAEAEYQVALDMIAAQGDQLAQLIPGRTKVLDLKQAQALLDDQTTLLSYWVTDETSLVFILTQNSLDVVELKISREDLKAQIETFRSFASIQSAYPDSSEQLYKSIIEPIKPFLTKPYLVIIPHQELHYLPFGALTDGTRYLVDDYTITYLPSISALPFIRQNANHANMIPLIIGNPTTNNPNLKPLPFAEGEAQVIAALYQTQPLVGSAATESALRAQASQVGILHIAAHADYNSINPLYSTLYLAPDQQQDGLLETHEIYGLTLSQVDLVVLSACETQLGKLSTGDELVGLSRAFFFAGTPTVISSLWEVDDKATELVMKEFYTNWRNGMSKQDALRQAQIAIRTTYPSPYYWAGFVLSGDGGKAHQPVDVPKSDSTELPNCLSGPLFGMLAMSTNWIHKNKKRHQRRKFIQAS